MFLLRCLFWLSIVYASMSWAPGTLAPSNLASDVIASTRSETQALIKTAAANAAELCSRNPRECLADAARLTSVIDASKASLDADTAEPEMTTTVPLPVPDPRRHVRDAKLALAH